MTNKCLRNAGALALAFLMAASAFGQSQRYAVDFTFVADTTRGFQSFGDFPALNNQGEVAFQAVMGGNAGVFRCRADGRQLATIASPADGLGFFGQDVAMNSSGLVAFGATITANGARAIFRSDGVTKTRIADSLTDGLFKLGVGSPSINDAGVVAFSSALFQRGTPGAVFTGDGGPLTTLASTALNGFTRFQNAAINGSGTVVFVAASRDGTQGVYTVPGEPKLIVDTNQRPDIDNFLDPVINEAGTVGGALFLIPSGAPQMFTANGKGLVARSELLFENSEHPSMNNHGAIAFSPITDTGDGPTGLFLEVSGAKAMIPIVLPGDQLFGSAVTKVRLGRFALNERFQMAFSYTLLDGRSGVAIASYNGEKQRSGQ